MIRATMVKPAHRRVKKYKDGLDPNLIGRKFKAVRDVMVDLETPYLAQIAEIERKVKRICEVAGVQTHLIAQYINYAREVYSKCKRFESVTLAAEVQFLVDKWVSRGLVGNLLISIAGLFGVTPTAPAPTPTLQMATGQYTGDGTIAQAITGIGFTPKVVWVWNHHAIETINDTPMFFKTDQEFGDLCVYMVSTFDHLDNRLISIDADGFTVDDDGVNADPNTSAQLYNYVVWG